LKFGTAWCSRAPAAYTAALPPGTAAGAFRGQRRAGDQRQPFALLPSIPTGAERTWAAAPTRKRPITPLPSKLWPRLARPAVEYQNSLKASTPEVFGPSWSLAFAAG